MGSRIANWLMVVVFVASAVVQYNDPDPYLWILIYLVAAALCIPSTLAGWKRVLASLLAVGSGLGAVYLGSKVIGQQSLLGSEEGREMLGLVVVSAWMSLLAFRAWKAPQTPRSS